MRISKGIFEFQLNSKWTKHILFNRGTSRKCVNALCNTTKVVLYFKMIVRLKNGVKIQKLVKPSDWINSSQYNESQIGKWQCI